jgi:hypothetical protein
MHRRKNNIKVDLKNRVRVRGSGWGPVTGSCEHGNEPPGSTKAEELID